MDPPEHTPNRLQPLLLLLPMLMIAGFMVLGYQQAREFKEAVVDRPQPELDRLFGGAGNDLRYGDGPGVSGAANQGHDYLDGGTGLDTLWGGVGNDRLLGNLGNDTPYGEEGDEQLHGGSGPGTPTGRSGPLPL